MFNYLINIFKFFYSTRYLHYAAVGVFGSALNLGSTYVVTERIRVYYMLSYAISTLLTWTVVFFAHSRITFRGHDRSRQHHRFVKFITVYGAAFLTNSALVYFFTEFLHVYYLLSITLVTVVLSIGTFLLNKKKVFHKHKDNLVSAVPVMIDSVNQPKQEE